MPFDVGVGIMLGLWLGPQESAGLNAVIGSLFVLLPDFDLALFYILKQTKRFKISDKLRDHREIFHYPLIYIFIGSMLAWLLGPQWLPLFIAASLAQFLHDSFGIGWGIPWLYPFSKKYFKFLYQYDLHRAGKPQKFMWAWSKAEQNKLIDKYGDKEWHRHTFQVAEYAFLWHVGEVVVLLVGIIVLILSL